MVSARVHAIVFFSLDSSNIIAHSKIHIANINGVFTSYSWNLYGVYLLVFRAPESSQLAFLPLKPTFKSPCIVTRVWTFARQHFS